MLRSVRRSFGTPPWIAAICVALAVFVTRATDTSGADRLRASARFSGVDLYRGLVLAHGPVADLIPEIRDHYRVTSFVTDPEHLQLVEAVQQRILQAVAAVDPAFFATFAALVRSGDPLAIQRGLELAAGTTLAAIAGIPEVQQLRQRAREDPGVRQRILSEIRAVEGLERISDEDLGLAVDLILADSLDLGARGNVAPDGSIVVIIVAVAAIVAAVTVVAAQSYAAALNIATSVNIVAAAVFWVTIFVADINAGSRLLQEQLVHSVATLLAS